MNAYVELFIAFNKIGGLTFGGGFSMLPMMEKELIEKRKWLADTELRDFFAVSQCLPGMMGINTALFIGNRLKGPLGGIVAALGVMFPSLVVITAIAAFLGNFTDLPIVQNAFAGIRACVLVFILNAVLNLRKGSLIDTATVLLCALVCVLSIVLDVSPALFIVFAILAGILLRGGKAAKK